VLFRRLLRHPQEGTTPRFMTKIRIRVRRAAEVARAPYPGRGDAARAGGPGASYRVARHRPIASIEA